MKLSVFFRRVHKWVGLILGLQFVLWTISGAAMALLDHEQVSGGHHAGPAAAGTATLPGAGAWATVSQSLGEAKVTGVTIRPLLGRQIFELNTTAGVQLFDAESGGRVSVGGAVAQAVAAEAYHGSGFVKSVAQMEELTLAVREHELPIWRVDFEDAENSSFYISGVTGQLLEKRDDTWRLWDFFWMLHNMDYLNRTSFNHPLIVTVAFGVLWLAITGVYLVFKSSWRQETRWLRAGSKAR